jgi:hypothetical protein
MMSEIGIGKVLQCQRCGKIWTYRGENAWVATCTFCKTTVSINKTRVLEQFVIIKGEALEPVPP